jgi:hypothetical protein
VDKNLRQLFRLKSLRIGNVEGSLNMNIARMNKSKSLIWTGLKARIEERSAFKILTGKSSGERHLGRP